MKKLLAILLTLAMVFCMAACASTEPAAAEATEEPAQDRTYTYSEDCGGFTIEWSVMLCADGTFVLQETHGLSGDVTNHAGLSYTDNGDGTVTTGEWYDFDCDKSDFFAFNGTCTWILNDDGTCEPADTGAAAAAGAINPGKYLYSENRGDFTIEWEIMLNGDGSFILQETHGLSGEVTQHTGSEWTDNGDGTATTGPWDEDANKSEFFAPNGVATWKINDDGTCEPIVDEAAGAAADGSVNPGKYVYIEERGDFTITWSVLLMGNGNCNIEELHGLSGETTTYVADGWTDNGDGTATTGAWEDPSVEKSEFFNEDGSCTWTIYADGTCEPVVIA